jgi:nucleoside phosphorylase
LIIVVRLVPDWGKITSLFLLMGCLVIAWTNKPAHEVDIFIVVIAALVVAYPACYAFYRLLDKYKLDEGESHDATFAGNVRPQSRFPERPHGKRTPACDCFLCLLWESGSSLVSGTQSLTAFTDRTKPRLQQHNTWNGTGTAIRGRIYRTYSLYAPVQIPCYQDYSVGWISALPIELATARASLDELYDSLPAPKGDDNAYFLGRIGLHNVVITCLPSGRYGPVPAAAVATRMLSTFPSIRFGLMVGIGGGVPSQADIRLGDVVVSKPSVRSGGVLRCGNDFEQTSTLNNPPYVLLNAMSNLRATHLVEGHRISELLSGMLNRNPALTDSVIPKESDRLFAACYDHPGETGSCNSCDERHLIVRKNRAGLSPQIHYGQIASITRVLKNGAKRDEIARRLGGTLCFEMEAAGLMDNFPCLVIRGISDYADSHKNDHWQGYAAATAAAYAKELLSVITPRQVTTEREASQLYA